jgi:hypothetical protein
MIASMKSSWTVGILITSEVILISSLGNSRKKNENSEMKNEKPKKTKIQLTPNRHANGFFGVSLFLSLEATVALSLP